MGQEEEEEEYLDFRVLKGLDLLVNWDSQKGERDGVWKKTQMMTNDGRFYQTVNSRNVLEFPSILQIRRDRG